MKIYPALISNGKILCNRCLNKPGEIRKYGLDEQGYWFIADCSVCGGAIRWYRSREGTLFAEEIPRREPGFVVEIDGDVPVLHFSGDEER